MENAPRHHPVHLPAPTVWPIALAFGITLMFTALVTNIGIGALGLVVTVFAAIGWFREVLPVERIEYVEVSAAPVDLTSERRTVARVEVSETHRAQLPLQTFPISSGIKGGLAGGTAMIIPAEIYGLLKFHSIWYTVNLLGGAGVAGWVNPTDTEIAHFRLSALVTAIIIHTVSSLLVGLLYGAMLPVWPRRPMLLGGLVAPALWTGLLHSTLGIVNPFLQQRINWWWFGVSQVFFGLVAGYTVSRLGHLRRLKQVPLAVRLGIESPGLMHERKRKRPR